MHVSRLLSLVTCARDPDPVLFDRLIRAVEGLTVPAGWEREWVIVDHRSKSPLRTHPVVSEALGRSNWIRVVEDDSPRISGARARSIGECSGEALIVFDDDCVPAGDYLTATVALLDTHAQVHCWGPGRVTLDWLGAKPPAWLSAIWRTTFFQERAATTPTWASERGWPSCYASGVGMVMRMAPAREYAARVRDGRYKYVTRTKATVVRGEDAQMLWTAVLLGGSAGVSPTLALTHAVPSNRLDLAYLRRLTFGLRESALPCRLEVFGLGAEGRPSLRHARREFLPQLYRAIRKSGGREYEQGILEAADALGALASVWQVHERPEPWWLRALIARYGVR